MENNLPATEAPAHHGPQAPARPAHPYRAFAMRIGLGLAILGFLLWHYDARPALRTLSREHLIYFAAAVALYAMGQVTSACRWRLLAAMLNVRGSYLDFIRYYFIGAFTNVFVPGVLGGDAARAFYLGRRHGKVGESIASAVADRAYGLLGLIWLAALMATLNLATLSANVTRPVLAIGIVTFAGFLASPQIARLIHMTPRPVRRALGIIAPYLHKPARVIPAIILSMILQTLLAICQYVLALGLGLHLPLSIFMLIVPVSGVLASLPLTLNGLGLRETAYLYLFGMTGVGRDTAIALGLLFFSTTMVTGLLGGIAFVTTEVPAHRAEGDQELKNAI
jgi:glycosyltransferase 2 family protein